MFGFEFEHDRCVFQGGVTRWVAGPAITTHPATQNTPSPPQRVGPKIMRADLICIDDIGLLPVTNDTAEALYRVVDAAYEKRSIALSSNLHPAR